MRFYKPRLREYVSTQVDMPWEFLQGVAEQKQKGYDTAMLAGDAATNLLNFNVIPGDEKYKQEKQKQYNDQIYKVRDYLMQTGDFNSAARDLSNITRQMNQDQDLAIMKAAVAPYEKDREAYEKMKQEGKLRFAWQSQFDPMYSTRNSTGRHKSYNQLVGYAAPDYYKDASDFFGKLELSTDEQGRTYFLDDQGIKRDVTQGGGAILKKHILNRAETALPAYRNSGSYNDHINRAQWELTNGLNPELIKAYEEKGQSAISERADELARQNLVSTNLDQIKSQNKLLIKDDLYSEEDRKARGLKTIEQEAIPVQDVGIKTKGKVFDISNTTSTKDVAIPGQTYATSKQTTYETPYKLKQQGKLPDNEWHMMGNYLMKSNPSLYNKVFGEGLGSKASQEDLKQAYEQFKNYHDILYAEAGSNAKVRAVTNPTNLHAMFGGVKSADLTLSNLEGSPGIGSQGYLYDLTNNKFLTVEELKNQVGNKKLKININKEILPYNGFNIVAEANGIPNPDQFTTGYGFTLQGPSGEEGHQYIIGKPPEYRSDEEIAANRLYSAKLIPGEVKEVMVDGKKVYAVYDPDIPLNDFAEARQQGQDVGGKIYVYKTKDAANRLSRNPNDFILEPQGTRKIIVNGKEVDNPKYIYLSDPVNVLRNLKEKLEEEKNK